MPLGTLASEKPHGRSSVPPDPPCYHAFMCSILCLGWVVKDIFCLALVSIVFGNFSWEHPVPLYLGISLVWGLYWVEGIQGLFLNLYWGLL